MKFLRTSLLIILLLVSISDIGWCSDNTIEKFSTIDSTSISIEFKNTSLETALKQLMDKANREIVYNDALIKGKQISFSFHRETLFNILKMVLDEFDLEFKELNSGQIVIIERSIKNLSVKGYISDSETSEPLAYANVTIKGTKLGTYSDQHGYFDLVAVPILQNRLVVNFMGYHPEEIILDSNENHNPIHVKLQKQVFISEAIQVTSSNELLHLNNPVHSTQLSLSPILMNNISSFGDFNVIHAVEWMPGVSGVNDDLSSGLRVRGGTSDQNLVLFDGIQIYQTDHFFGLVSGFNSDAIKGIQFYRGGFPAIYGGRTSSVLLLNGNSSEPFQNYASAGINLLSANASIHWNFGEKVSFSISGRRSYTDIIDNGVFRKLYNYVSQLDTTSASSDEVVEENKDKSNLDFYYYDLNSKLNIKPTENDQISINFYGGYDFLDQSYSSTRNPRYPVTDYTDISKWGNIGASCNWNHKFSDKYKAALSSSISRFNSNADFGNIDSNDASEMIFTENSIEEISLKLDNSYAFKDYLQFDYGIHFTQNNVKYRSTFNDSITRFEDNAKAVSSIGYFQSIWKPVDKLTLTSGLRFTHYSLTNHLNTAPRFSFSWDIYNQLKLTGAYSHHYQFVDQIKNGSVLRAHQRYWALSDKFLKPGFAKHFIAGIHWDMENYLLSVEAYHKDLDNVKEYIYNNVPANLIRTIFQGSGVAQGVEFLAMKKYNDFSGWFSYTLGKVEYKIPIINDGLSFPADHDRLHELKLVTMYKYEKWNFGLTWLFTTGANYTPLVRSNNIAGYTAGPKNSEILPDYHRMDINISRKFYYRSLIIDLGVSAYNVYDKENIIYRTAVGNRDRIEILDTKMLGLIPAIYLKVSCGK
jgi:hypothetical protein